MISFIKRKLAKAKQRKTFQEYGTHIDVFQVEGYGKVEFAQWEHPFEKPKAITKSNIEFYKKLASKGGLIIDIGAHGGDTTVPMALAVEKEGLVLGFEPNRFVFKVLEENAALNPSQTNIDAYCLAITEDPGKFEFNYSDASFCNGGFLSEIENQRHNHPYTLEVEGVNLEAFMAEKYPEELKNLDLLKIDAEGYDKEILRTIPNILKDQKPNLMVECYKKLSQEERDELYSVLDQNGYELYRLDNFEDNGEKVRIFKDNMSDEKHFEILGIHKEREFMW